jgi:hypothetical protein
MVGRINTVSFQGIAVKPVDMQVDVPPVSISDLHGAEAGEHSAVAAKGSKRLTLPRLCAVAVSI